MGLKLSVKIGDVTNLSDARYAAGMGVDYIGFNIDVCSDNFITASKFKEITNWISGVGIIGEIGESIPSNQDEFISYLTETTSASLLTNKSVYKIDARNLSMQYIKQALSQEIKPLFYILILTPAQIDKFTSDLTMLCAKKDVYISSSFTKPLLEIIINQIQPKGIEIKGGLEDQPGFKEYDDIADVLEWLEEED